MYVRFAFHWQCVAKDMFSVPTKMCLYLKIGTMLEPTLSPRRFSGSASYVFSAHKTENEFKVAIHSERGFY